MYQSCIQNQTQSYQTTTDNCTTSANVNTLISQLENLIQQEQERIVIQQEHHCLRPVFLPGTSFPYETVNETQLKNSTQKLPATNDTIGIVPKGISNAYSIVNLDYFQIPDLPFMPEEILGEGNLTQTTGEFAL